jgi:hypothetical protein
MHSIFALPFYAFLCFQHVIAADVSTYKPIRPNRVNVQLDQPLAVAPVEAQVSGPEKGIGKPGKPMKEQRGVLCSADLCNVQSLAAKIAL